MSIELVILSNCLIFCRTFLFLPSVFPSNRIFSNESVLHIRWPKQWRFSFSEIHPSSEYAGLISFKIDLFDLFAVQDTLKSLLQHHNLKPQILQCSALLMVHLSYLYMTDGKSHQFSSVQFSRSFVSDSLRPHESQHARPPCPSPSPGVHSKSRPSSR